LRAGFLTLYLLLVYQHVWAQCRTEVTEAPILRLESRAEQIADLRLICAGLAPPGTANFTVTLTSPIATPITGVRLEVGQPPFSYNPTLEGTRQIRFSNVTLPAGVDSAVRITGLRVDLASFDATLRANPPAVRTTLSAGPITVTNPELVAGYPASSLSARLIDASTNQPTTSLDLRPGNLQSPTHLLHFRERFRGAFRTPSQEPIAPHGTLLVAEFSNLPVGAGISVALADGLRYARLVASEANPIPIVQPTAQYFPLPITNGRATAVWEVTENATPGTTYAFAIIATGPAVTAGARLRYGPTQSPALPRFDTAAKLDPLDCLQNCFSTPAVMSFTRRFGQPPPANAALPVEFTGQPFPLQARAYPETTQFTFSLAPLGNSFELRFVDSPLAPGRYTTIVDLRPTAGGPSQYTLVVLTVSPPATTEVSPVLCQPSTAGPTALRAEGLTEPAADVLLHCRGGQPGQFITTNIRVDYNALVTSRALDPNSNQGTEALLFLNDPAQPVVGVNEFPHNGRRPEYYVEFRNVTLQIPSRQPFQLRVSNVRLDARTLARHFTSPQPIVAQAFVSATGPIAIPRVILNVGTVQPAYDFALRDHLNNPAFRITPTPLTADRIHHQLHFQEGFPTAFRRRNAATSVASPLDIADQSISSVPFFSETMVYAAARGVQGLATQGTHLSVNFARSTGGRVFVTLHPLVNSSGTIQARLLKPIQDEGAGPFEPVAQEGVALFDGVSYPIAEAKQSFAVWEILESSPMQLEEVRFGVVVLFPDGPQEIDPRASLTRYVYPAAFPRFEELDFAPFQLLRCSSFGCLEVQGSLEWIQQPGPLIVERVFPLRSMGADGHTRYDASSDVPWLKVDRPIEFSASSIRLTTDATGLPPGVHRGNLRLGSAVYPVSLSVPYRAGPGNPDPPPFVFPSKQRFAGYQALLDFTAVSLGGVERLGIVNVLINSSLDGARACYIAYSRPAGALFLVDDSGPAAGLSPPLIPGSSGQISNSQCTLHGANTEVSAVGGLSLRLKLNLSFSTSFGGGKAIYAAARTINEVTQGRALSGTLDIPEPPSFPRANAFSPPLPFTPLDGEPVHFTYEDATSADNLETVWGLMNTSVDARGACYFAYYVPGNLLFLYPDDGDGAAARSMPLNSTRTLSNSQCTIVAAGANVVKSGNQLRLTLRYYLKPEFRQSHGSWGAAKSLNNPQASPWKLIGQP
jgi:hypothetical protein